MEPGVTSLSNTSMKRMKQREMPNMNCVNPPEMQWIPVEHKLKSKNSLPLMRPNTSQKSRTLSPSYNSYSFCAVFKNKIRYPCRTSCCCCKVSSLPSSAYSLLWITWFSFLSNRRWRWAFAKFVNRQFCQSIKRRQYICWLSWQTSTQNFLQGIGMML